MRINPITQKEFTLLELADVATRYYDNYRSKQIISGFERCIATDGINTMFVFPNYKPRSANEAVFYCSVRRGCDARNEVHGTGCMLIRTYEDGPKDPIFDGIDTDHEMLIRAAHKAFNPRFFARGNEVCYMGRWYVLKEYKKYVPYNERQQENTNFNTED